MLIIQIIIIIFVLLIFWQTFLKFKKKEINILELLIWSIIWSAIVFVVINPNIANFIANLVGVGRGADLVIYISIITIFYLLFRIIVKIERIERDITKIIRKIALDDKNKKEKNEN